MIVVKTAVLLILFLISFQDIKSRLVYWFLFPLVGVSMSILFFNKVTANIFWINVTINLGLVLVVLAILYGYTVMKLKLNFWKDAFGLGDALFFVAFAISFPIVSFLILFVGSLFFSLIVGFFYPSKKEDATIPLAGYMALYLIMVFLGAWIYPFNLYLI